MYDSVNTDIETKYDTQEGMQQCMAEITKWADKEQNAALIAIETTTRELLEKRIVMY